GNQKHTWRESARKREARIFISSRMVTQYDRGSRIEDRGSRIEGLGSSDCGLRINSYEMSQAKGDTIKAGFSESINPQSAIRNQKILDLQSLPCARRRDTMPLLVGR